jgi:hypothetical protein
MKTRHAFHDETACVTRLQTIGDTKAVVSKYLARTQEGKDGQKALSDNQTRKSIFFKSVSILNHDHRVSTSLDVTQPFNICVQLEVKKDLWLFDLPWRIAR